MTTRYRIEHLAGEGGFGKVHKAFDTTLERNVAIKTLDPLFSSGLSEADKQRFRREARVLANLSHPSIPAIYDIQSDEAVGEFRIIFEWIDGQSVTEQLRERGIAALDQTKAWFSDICSALTHAHSKNIIHRDIKPANLVLATSARACYVVDFGIALTSDEATRLTGSTGIGTPGYMAPEQERAGTVTAAADIYALGIVLYECLAGRRPQVGGYQPLNSINEAIPPAVDELVQSCIREDPTRRPQSAADFFIKFERALQPHANFSEVLSSGSLHEVQIAIQNMTPKSYAQLPRGQQLNVLSRLKDLTRVDEPRLRNAVASVLSDLVRVISLCRDKDIEFVIENAVFYGYDKTFGESWFGNERVRVALNEVAIDCRDSAHAVIARVVLEHFRDSSLDERGRWYFHDLRILLQNLLANPDCTESDAEELAQLLDTVNEVSH